MHPSYHKTRLKLHGFVSLTGSLIVRVRLGGKGCQKDTQTGWPWEALETLFTLRKCHSATVPPRVAMKFTFCGHNSKVATSNVTWLKNENNSTSCTKLILLVLDNPYYKQNMWLIFSRQHIPFRTFCPLTTIFIFRLCRLWYRLLLSQSVDSHESRFRCYLPKAASGNGWHTKVTKCVVCWFLSRYYVPMHGKRNWNFHFVTLLCDFKPKFPAQPSYMRYRSMSYESKYSTHLFRYPWHWAGSARFFFSKK